jgi:hypothetical protein
MRLSVNGSRASFPRQAANNSIRARIAPRVPIKARLAVTPHLAQQNLILEPGKTI